MRSGKRVLIIQPYIPDYRVKFFDLLVERMRSREVAVHVVAPVRNSDSRRGDETAGHDWHLESTARAARIGPATFTYYGSRKLLREADAVIVPAAGTCLDTHLALYSRGIRTGLWGHIANYVKAENAVDRAVERRQIRRADHIFAYMPSGARQAVADGVPSDHVTAVMNTIDTADIRELAAQLTPIEIEEFGSSHGLTGRPVLAYIGSLDDSKRVQFLADALDHLWNIDAEVRLVVMGRGDQEHLLADASARRQVIMLGRVGARSKALASKFAHAIANPGRIGLVAVDSLALRLPIITAAGAFHAPEYEYLTEGSTLFTASDDPRAYALELASRRPSAMARGEEVPSLQSMCRHFSDGIGRMLEA